MLRRFALVVIVLVYSNHLVLQVAVMVFCSTVQVGYLMSYKPIVKPLPLKLDVVNEITTVILVDSLTIFSPANPIFFDLEGDILFLALLFGNLSIHLFFLLKSAYKGAKKSCKRCRKRCCGKSKEEKKKEKKEKKKEKKEKKKAKAKLHIL